MSSRQIISNHPDIKSVAALSNDFSFILQDQGKLRIETSKSERVRWNYREFKIDEEFMEIIFFLDHRIDFNNQLIHKLVGRMEYGIMPVYFNLAARTDLRGEHLSGHIFVTKSYEAFIENIEMNFFYNFNVITEFIETHKIYIDRVYYIKYPFCPKCNTNPHSSIENVMSV